MHMKIAIALLKGIKEHQLDSSLGGITGQNKAQLLETINDPEGEVR